MDMLDGNTALESQYAHRQSARNRDYEQRAPGVINELAKQIVVDREAIEGCDGRVWRLADFFDHVTGDDLTRLLDLKGDVLADYQFDLTQRSLEEAKEWLRDAPDGNAIVEARLNDE